MSAPTVKSDLTVALRELVRATAFVEGSVRVDWDAGRKSLIVHDAQLSPEQLLRLRAARDCAREALGEPCSID